MDKKQKIKNLFNTDFPIIGVLHLPPLPGSFYWDGNWDNVLEKTINNALNLINGGVDSIIIENYGDIPFCKDKVDPVTVSSMTVLGIEVKKLLPCNMTLGINVLRNDGFSAIAIATVVGAQFIRLNILSGVMITDQGIIEGKAHELKMYQRSLGINIPILADVLVKHAVPLQYQSIDTVSKDTFYRNGAFGLIVTGKSTGEEVDIQELKKVNESVPQAPIFIGSGITTENIPKLINYCDGIIVGTSLKDNDQYNLEKIKSLTSLPVISQKKISSNSTKFLTSTIYKT